MTEALEKEMFKTMITICAMRSYGCTCYSDKIKKDIIKHFNKNGIYEKDNTDNTSDD